MMDMVSTLAVVSGLHLTMAISPGPNTLAICCAASAGTRRDGLSVAAGVIAATGLWVGIALLGADAVADRNGQVFPVLRTLAGLYLIWIGVRMLGAGSAGGGVMAGRRPFLLGLLTALANPFSIAFWLGTFLAALPAAAPDRLYAEVFILIIGQSVIWYCLLAVLFSSAMRGRGLAAARLMRYVAAGVSIAIGVGALVPA